MKKYLIIFTVGLLACARTQGNDTLYLGFPLHLSQERTIPDSLNDTVWEWESDTDENTEFSFVLGDSANIQRFNIRVTITFPRMTLQQAAELEARLKKLLPEAQEINLDSGRDVKVPVDEFYYVPQGAVFRTVPGFYQQSIEILPHEMKFYLPPTAPLKGSKSGRILQADSTVAPVWQEF